MMDISVNIPRDLFNMSNIITKIIDEALLDGVDELLKRMKTRWLTGKKGDGSTQSTLQEGYYKKLKERIMGISTVSGVSPYTGDKLIDNLIVKQGQNGDISISVTDTQKGKLTGLIKRYPELYDISDEDKEYLSKLIERRIYARFR